MSYHCTENSYMITIAVQIQLPYLQAPKWRLSLTLDEVARILLKSCWGGVGEGGGSDKHSSPSAGHEAPSSSRLYSCWPRSVYRSGVSFLSFHLSLYREGCTVVDKKYSHHGCETGRTLSFKWSQGYKRSAFSAHFISWIPIFGETTTPPIKFQDMRKTATAIYCE